MKIPTYARFNKDTKEVIPVSYLQELGGEFFISEDRIIGRDNIGGVLVSTVFLGINHRFSGNKDLWFETLVFGGEHDEYMERYETWEKARIGHSRIVEMVKTSSK